MRERQVRSARWLLAAVTCAILAIDPPALAAPPAPPAPPAAEDAHADEEAARAHFDRGMQLIKEATWEEALGEFRAALALFPRRVSLLQAAAVCLQNLKRYDEALDLLEPLLGAGGAALEPALKAKIESQP